VRDGRRGDKRADERGNERVGRRMMAGRNVFGKPAVGGGRGACAHLSAAAWGCMRGAFTWRAVVLVSPSDVKKRRKKKGNVLSPLLVVRCHRIREGA
jgi:hypothetical protein